MKEKILKKIQEVCPELMELGFGCRVIDEVGTPEIVLWSQENWKGWTDVQLNGTAIPIKKEELTEILGKPPHLEHLLRAIPNKNFCATADGQIGCNTSDLYIWENYNLSLSLEQNLDNPELCSFIHSLICEKV